jgi:CheY-like chemotaxis protein
MKPRKSRRGRPAAGLKPGERVSDYPQLSVRVPQSTIETLHAVCSVTGDPQWRVLADAVNRYIARLPDDRRRLLEGLLERGEKLFKQPARRRRHSTTKNRPIIVLNVDDHEPMLYARSTMLRKEGWEVLEASTGRAALDVLKKHRPHVVVLDVHLPDIDGLEICRLIKSDPRTRDIKVVQVSATVKTPLDQLRGLEQGGADIFLTEPLPRGTLLSVIERLLESGTAA